MIKDSWNRIIRLSGHDKSKNLCLLYGDLTVRRTEVFSCKSDKKEEIEKKRSNFKEKEDFFP